MPSQSGGNSAPSIRWKGRKGHLNMSHLRLTANAGLPKQAKRFSSSTCMVTESPYYSKFACNGWSSLLRQDRQGYKEMATTSESPAAWEEGGQLSANHHHMERAC